MWWFGPKPMARKRPFSVFLRLLIQTTQSLSALTYIHVHMVVVRGSELEREMHFGVQWLGWSVMICWVHIAHPNHMWHKSQKGDVLVPNTLLLFPHNSFVSGALGRSPKTALKGIRATGHRGQVPWPFPITRRSRQTCHLLPANASVRNGALCCTTSRPLI